MELTKAEVASILATERRRLDKQRKDRDRNRRLKDVGAKIARAEGQQNELTGKLERLYKRLEKLQGDIIQLMPQCTCKNRDDFDVGTHELDCPVYVSKPIKFRDCPVCHHTLDGNYCKTCDRNVY